MPRNLRITRIVVTHFSFVVNDLGPEENLGFDQVYRPGYRLDQDGSILTIETDAGITGEVPGSIDRRDALYMLGRNPLERDTIWHDLKRAQRGWMNAPTGAMTWLSGTSPASSTVPPSTSYSAAAVRVG
jgi:hypothetical protein